MTGTGLVVALVGLVIAASAQVMINIVVLKRFRICSDRLKLLEDEVIGDSSTGCMDIEEMLEARKERST